ncbi:hypothetical protein I6A84_43370 [Frankia sp. CNm7]|uniref:Uncharacterized protein n=1 Tax=Frankia nepalensis TaxID=1836974 RepID=A0A937URY8_9ACTN|nr:hypothetical protein [Frankia nepalensis]MBL7502192.1 hypothetical protein [Frankia nepalensis]MBL7510542.1 hypothetical protein [Frankia nepalensis]MBL7524706.1 hypothetical protein [Frankia nepalensis]MBL7633329.1 hypothetical protein [Frankia nepalensis]
MTAVARLADGLDAGGEVSLVSLALPEGPGLVVRRRSTGRRPGRIPVVASTGRPSLLAARSAAVVGDAAGLEFLEVSRTELTRVAVTMGRMSHLLSVVMYPAGVPPYRTALAVAAADLLRQERGDGRPVVTCGNRPLLGSGRSAVPHAVRVDSPGGSRDQIVWEIVAWEDMPTWLAGLRSDAGAAAAG